MNKNIRIKSVQENPKAAVLHLLITANDIEKEEDINISTETGKSILATLSKKPFKTKVGDEYTYWITGVGNLEKLISKNGETIKTICYDPIIFLLICRGKSRLKEEIPCTIRDWAGGLSFRQCVNIANVKDM